MSTMVPRSQAHQNRRQHPLGRDCRCCFSVAGVKGKEEKRFFLINVAWLPEVVDAVSDHDLRPADPSSSAFDFENVIVVALYLFISGI